MISLGLHPLQQSGPGDVPQLARGLSASLRRNRHALARRLMEAVAGWEKYDRKVRGYSDRIDDYIKLHFYVFVDYLERYFRTGDEAYRYLYIGEKLKQFYDRSLDPEQDRANRVRVTDADIEVLCGAARRDQGAAAAGLLESLLRDVQRVVLARGRKHLEVLWIGDCLYLDVRGFLAASALEDGLTFEPTFVGAKNPVQQREELRKLSGRRFDLVFYSPFTYEFSPEFTRFQRLQGLLTSRREIGRIAAAEMEHVEKMLEILATLFDAPSYVHNTAHVRRHDSTPRELAKVWLTRRARRIAREAVNARLAERIAAWRAADGNVILLDETGLLDRHGEVALGRCVYPTPIQHPAELGRFLAGRYRDILAAHADLVGKKVLVCDLDNTLWEGEIGEGPVEHFVGLQRTVKELRCKGVLLAINSKNDPRNVRWDGALLGEDDFVAAQINWDSKVANLRRIQRDLNLKLKDFAFLDDRADQRELVREALPEVCVLDATSPRVPERLAAWAAALSDHPEVDRTQQYRQREQRESFLAGAAAAAEEDSALAFSALGIRVEIREATAAELRRVAELINRTNQFNMAGSRTSLRELRDWQARPGRRVVVVDARDKFGPMGLISALCLDLTGGALAIPVFVLSCRVFGYGIEDAVLGAVRRLARAGVGGGAMSIRGAFTATPHNEPCREVYPRNGFTFDGESWVLTDVDSPRDPAWLTVADRL
jgi:FkbH-like protein